MDVLDQLIEEHRSVQALLRTLATTEPGNVRSKTFDALERSLTTHMEIEERYLYPIVERTVGADERAGAENEHELTRSGLTRMRELLAEPGFVAAVEMLQTGVSHHVEEEETTVFPRLRKKAASDVAALGELDDLKGSTRVDELGELTKDELYHQAQEAGIEGRSSMSKSELQDALAQQ